jgi:hypothetical protein
LNWSRWRLALKETSFSVTVLSMAFFPHTHGTRIYGITFMSAG